jgi:hypothetical protein
MIVGAGALDGETRASLLTDSRELDLRAALRVLRERVVDATGLIEDGSAGEQWAPVLGRWLDGAALRRPTGHPPIEGAAPDLIAAATEAAALALGWTDPAGLRAFLAAHSTEPGAPAVAVRLPPPPRHHGPAMELRAVIDRGDVWYDFPYDAAGRRLAQPIERRPVLTVWARDGDRDVALLRWPTTIGGWQRERLPGGAVRLAYKGSDVGPRVWRDLVAAPAWYPPPTTPDRELVRRGAGGRWVPRWDTFGPGYRSAYGLIMLVHHARVERRAGERFDDNGVRSHGTGDYRSLLGGSSHGCHRLYSHLALRLGGFLLAHRAHQRRGLVVEPYRRVVWGMAIDLRDRGYQYELTPPVDIVVLEGRVRGRRRQPITRYLPLP